MGKNTGFLDYARENDQALSPSERIKNFNEFHKGLDREKRREQGARCMNCGVPFCQSGMEIEGRVSGCPLHNLIPEWNDELWRDNWGQALARLLKTNNFPEFTGRVCPALCEAACTNGLYEDPVTVRENELAIIEDGFAGGLVKPHRPEVRSGRKAAVIGSGPAGLAAADCLNKRGHLVTVFERDEEPGGLLMYGIPNMKIEKGIVRRRIELMKAEGVEFRVNSDVGRNISVDEIKENFDAVIVCCGARKPRPSGLETDGVDGACYAVDYLSAVTRRELGGTGADSGMSSGISSGNAAGACGKAPEPNGAADALPGGQSFSLSAAGKNVIIIGGGDTGNDCVGTAIREGCKSVRQLIRKPREVIERKDTRDWPYLSGGIKTDYGQAEAMAIFGEDPRMFGCRVKELITENGALMGVRVIRSEAVEDSGKQVIRDIPGSEEILPCGLLLFATGFAGCEDYVADAFHIEPDKRGNLDAGTDGADLSAGDDSCRVFTAGDVRRGASLVVYAIAEGRAAAKAADEYLMGYTCMQAN